jgi:8-oxo-dGTP pyrophosphatase MutT (NUDIX family)
MPDRRGELVRLLRAYVPADAEEAAHVAATLRRLSESVDPFASSEQNHGHLTASAVVLDRHTDLVLLVFHPSLNRWLQPGGHVDVTDQDLLDTAVRETLEETGILLSRESGRLFDVDVHQIPASGNQSAHPHFDMRFLFVVLHREPTTPPEGSEARWCELNEAFADATDRSQARLLAKCRNL